MADVLVRLTVSHLVLPAAAAHTTGRRISQVALRYLAPRYLRINDRHVTREARAPTATFAPLLFKAA